MLVSAFKFTPQQAKNCILNLCGFTFCFVSKYKSLAFLSQHIYSVVLTCYNYLRKTHVGNYFNAKFEQHFIVRVTINQCKLYIFLIKMVTLDIRARFMTTVRVFAKILYWALVNETGGLDL